MIGNGSVSFLFCNPTVYFVFHVLMVLSFRLTPHCLEYLTIACLFPDFKSISSDLSLLLWDELHIIYEVHRVRTTFAQLIL